MTEDYEWEKVHNTNNLFLRFLGNRCQTSFGFAVMQMIFLDEAGKADTFMYKYWSFIARVCKEPMNKWSTFYKWSPDENSQP